MRRDYHICGVEKRFGNPATRGIAANPETALRAVPPLTRIASMMRSDLSPQAGSGKEKSDRLLARSSPSPRSCEERVGVRGSCNRRRSSRALFRGFRHDRQRHARQPVIEKMLQPGALGGVMERATFEVMM